MAAWAACRVQVPWSQAALGCRRANPLDVRSYPGVRLLRARGLPPVDRDLAGQDLGIDQRHQRDGEEMVDGDVGQLFEPSRLELCEDLRIHLDTTGRMELGVPTEVSQS